jgi:hypothetical protein
MRKIGLLGLSLVGIAAAANTQQEQAYFAILVETKQMKMAGMDMPEMPELPPGVTLPPGVVLPGQAKRGLLVRLWSPSIAPPDAKATLSIPPGLKLGDKLELSLYRPTAQENETGGVGGGQAQDTDFTIKLYWGSSDKVREGQPKIIKLGDLTPEQKAEMDRQQREARPGGGTSYFYKPNWTTGYWPAKNQEGTIKKDASLKGTYALSTTYTGNVTIDVPDGVEFMNPIDITAPDLKNEIDLKKAIPFQWKQIPGALGQNAMIMGMEGEKTLILWSSSETYSPQVMGDSGFLQMADVRQRVADKLFMPGDQTKMTVPAGIFAKSEFAMMNMAAYGPGAALDKAQPLPRVQTKSSLQLMLSAPDDKHR